MELYEACDAFASLAQDTRLRVFKYLIQYGQDGASPTDMAQELGIPPNTLSFHLSHMTKSNLVTSNRAGRSITYYANTEAIRELIGFLEENCCSKERRSKNSPIKSPLC